MGSELPIEKGGSLLPQGGDPFSLKREEEREKSMERGSSAKKGLSV